MLKCRVGTRISVSVGGNWSSYRSYILRYFRSLAVITPYAEFKFDFESHGGAHDIKLCFRRRSFHVPPVPRTVKHHPSSVDLLTLRRLMHDARPNVRFTAFLRESFQCISAAYARDILGELRSGGGAAWDDNLRICDVDDNMTMQLSTFM